jgi:hypothetical protein
LNTFSALIQLILKPNRLKSILSFNHKGYLKEIGWFNALETQSAIDAAGQPIPWVTYSFIDFIKERLNKQHQIFEFGSGNSTFFYAKYAGIVVSVEHNKDWFNKIQSAKPSNSTMIFSDLVYGADYCQSPLKLAQKFDVIIVDGRDRVNCCKQAIAALSNEGVIVLDDSERVIYTEAINFLLENGFKHLSFSGISPGLFYHKSTSVFYKKDNCLGL